MRLFALRSTRPALLTALLLPLAGGCELFGAAGAMSDDATLAGGDAAGLPGAPAGPREASIAAASEAAQSASNRFETLLDQNTANPIETLLEELAAAGQTASLSEDGATVLVTEPDGLTVGVLTDAKDSDLWVASPVGGVQGALEAGDSGIVCDEATHPRSKVACIVTAFQSEFAQNVGAMEGAMTRAGYQTRRLSLATVADVVALHDLLPSCGVLYLSSHGAVSRAIDGTRGNVIATAAPIARDAGAEGYHRDLADLTSAFGGQLPAWLAVMAHKGKAYWALTPAFFGSVSYPNTLVFADACHSATAAVPGGSLEASFRAAGAGAYLGWSGAISTRFSNAAADALFEGLAGQPVTIDSLQLITDPADPEAGMSYTPSATVSPAAADIPLSLSVSGTDGYSMTDPKSTDAAGRVTFQAVPGGAGGVVDTLTVVAGGAQNATDVSAVVSSAALQKVWTLPYNSKTETKSQLVNSAAPGFNLICANAVLAKTTTVVKF